MAIYQDNLSDVALEEKVNTAVKEVQLLAQQNAVMFEGLEEKITNLKREFAYLSQQNESVYDMTTDFVQEALDKTQANIESKLSDLEGKLASEEKEEPLVEFVVDYDRIIDGVVEKLEANKAAAQSEETPEETEATETTEEQTEEQAQEQAPAFDYDYLAEKIANNLTAMDYDVLAAKVAEKLAEAKSEEQAPAAYDFDALAQSVAEKVLVAIPASTCCEIDTGAISADILQKLQNTPIEVDVDSLVGVLADKIAAPVDVDALAESVASKVDLASLQLNVEDVADAVAAKIEVAAPTVDTASLAESIVEKMELPPLEVDFDELTQAVADKLVVPAAQIDAEELADAITARIQVPTAAIDYDAVAAKIMEALPEVDYDEIANRIEEKLNGTAEDVEAYLAEHGIEMDETDDAARVITAVEENSGKTNTLVEEVLAILKQKEFIPVAQEEQAAPVEEEGAIIEEPVQELVDEPAEEPAEETFEELFKEKAEEEAETEIVEELFEETAEEPVEEEPKQPTQEELEAAAALELSIAEAAAETAALEETAQEMGKTVRLKRSYECKLRQASDDVKYYYSEIKNELLSYGKVKGNMSWNADRYNFGRETIAKMSINGKTLCVYLALNPDEYSITKYHHKYVGDVKAYESTPMMVKVKSNMGLKKAVSLIFEMMEGLKAQRVHKKEIDYVSEYAYKSDEQMIAEGLIKASITEKKDLASF